MSIFLVLRGYRSFFFFFIVLTKEIKTRYTPRHCARLQSCARKKKKKDKQAAKGTAGAESSLETKENLSRPSGSFSSTYVHTGKKPSSFVPFSFVHQ